MDNQTAAEERAAVEKRKQAAEVQRANREKAMEASANNEDNDALDSVLEKLRSGSTAPRKSRRARPGTSSRPRPAVPQTLAVDQNATGEAADIARDMLAQLQSNFPMPSPSPTASVPSTRRRRKRIDTSGLDEEMLLSAAIVDEETDSEEKLDSPGPPSGQ